MQENIKNIKLLLNKEQLKAVILTSWANMFYVSGFSGTTATVLCTLDQVYLLVDSRYIEQARFSSSHCEIILVDAQQTVEKCIQEICLAKDIQVIGFEEDHMTVANYQTLKQKLQVSFKPCSFVEVRSIKSTLEIEKMQHSAFIADQVIEQVIHEIQVGMSELDVEMLLLQKIKNLGGDSFSFKTIVASGLRGAMPHGVASRKIIERNDMVTIDFGAIYQGYCSDLTRTFAMSRNINPKLVEIYNIVLEAQIAAINHCRPGVSCKEVDKIARDIIGVAGYQDFFQHGTGHGLGIDIHEFPRLNPQTDVLLQEGMVVTIEPGIYIPQLGGVRIEDDILITANGSIRLTKSSKDLKYIG